MTELLSIELPTWLAIIAVVGQFVWFKFEIGSLKKEFRRLETDQLKHEDTTKEIQSKLQQMMLDITSVRTIVEMINKRLDK